MTLPDPESTHIRWPADRFFWSVLDAPGVKAGRGVPSGLLTQLQEDLPISLDEVHAVGVPVPDGKLVVCGARRSELRELSPRCLRLSPEDLPLFLESNPDAAAFNLLVGDFEPALLRKERAWRAGLVTFTAVAMACLLSAGLLRRADAWTKASLDARSAASSVAANPASLHLKLETLRNRPRPSSKSLTAPDAALALASLLSAWPKGLECQADSVSVGPTTIVLALTISKDARPFLSALSAPEGWTLDEPRLTATSDGARLHLALHRKDGRS